MPEKHFLLKDHQSINNMEQTMSVNLSTEKEYPGTTFFILEKPIDDKTDAPPKIVEPPAKKFVNPSLDRITPKQGFKELRRTSDIPIRKDKHEERIQTPKGAKSDRAGNRKGDDYPVRSIVVPLSTFIDALLGKEIPVIPCKKWDEIVNRSIACQVLDPKFSQEKIPLIINDIYNRALEYSSILKRIERARILLFGIKQHRYLSRFPINSSPIHFWENYTTLEKESPDKCQDLYEIIGKKEALNILKKTTKSDGAVMKDSIQSQIKLVLVSYVEEKKRRLLKSSFSFEEGFDMNLQIVPTPIYLFHYQEFLESFRSHYSDGPFPEDCIRFNGHNLLVPDYNKLGVKDEDRQIYFLRWLISEMQMKLRISPEYNVEKQITLFETHLSTGSRENALKLHEAIRKCFKHEFKPPFLDKELPDKINAFFRKLQEHSDSDVRVFADQMAPHLDFIRKYLIEHKDFNKDWETVSFDLVQLRYRFDFLSLKQKKIPLLSLLKAMSYSSSLTGQLFMSKTLCPNLCTKGASPYMLVLNRTHITNYDILCDSCNFEVTHIKMFNIVSGDKVKANVQIHWTPKGKFDSIKYSASTVFVEFDYLPDCPLEERKIISDQFDLEFKDSPWGKYLKREDINDIFNAPPQQLSLLDMLT